MRQTLSITDLAILHRLATAELYEYQHRIRMAQSDHNLSLEERARQEAMLLDDPYYQDLIHLKNSLQNFEFVFDTPDITITQEAENE